MSSLKKLKEEYDLKIEEEYDFKIIKLLELEEQEHKKLKKIRPKIERKKKY